MGWALSRACQSVAQEFAVFLKHKEMKLVVFPFSECFISNQMDSFPREGIRAVAAGMMVDGVRAR